MAGKIFSLDSWTMGWMGSYDGVPLSYCYSFLWYVVEQNNEFYIANTKNLFSGGCCYLIITSARQEKADKEEEMKLEWMANNTHVSKHNIKGSSFLYHLYSEWKYARL